MLSRWCIIICLRYIIFQFKAKVSIWMLCNISISIKWSEVSVNITRKKLENGSVIILILKKKIYQIYQCLSKNGLLQEWKELVWACTIKSKFLTTQVKIQNKVFVDITNQFQTEKTAIATNNSLVRSYKKNMNFSKVIVKKRTKKFMVIN